MLCTPIWFCYNLLMALLTLCVLTYNRPEFLRQSLQSILAQSFTDFELVVVDNASDCDNQSLVESFHDPRLRYHRHATNIGVDGTWKYVFQHYRQTPYLMAFHDDDLMHPDYLRQAIALLESDKRIAIASSGFISFSGDPPPFSPVTEETAIYHSEAELITDLLAERMGFHYAPVIYRTEYLSHFNYDRCAPYETYYIFGDRPWVLEFCRFGWMAVLPREYILRRMHPGQDYFSPGLLEEHCFALYRRYRAALAERWGDWRTRFLFYRKSAYFMLDHYFHRLDHRYRNTFFRFLRHGKQQGVIAYPYVLFYPLVNLRIWWRDRSKLTETGTH